MHAKENSIKTHLIKKAPITGKKHEWLLIVTPLLATAERFWTDRKTDIQANLLLYRMCVE